MRLYEAGEAIIGDAWSQPPVTHTWRSTSAAGGLARDRCCTETRTRLPEALLCQSDTDSEGATSRPALRASVFRNPYC
jgi:hypothetical protein